MNNYLFSVVRKKLHVKNLLINKQGRSEAGFALIATISVMVLLVMLAVAMLTLSSVEMRSSNATAEMQNAQNNARMALMYAIAELQQSAGQDQRVTATASILENDPSLAPGSGHEHWVGVWDTSEYSPDKPEERKFVKWLVSSSDQSGLTNVEYAADKSSTATNGSEIYGDTVQVPLVDIADDQGVVTGKYAYWVEDEGVKADLGWNEGEETMAERKQASRLSATPGPDYLVLGGPFESGVSHPITNDSSDWLERLENATSPADMPLVMQRNDGFRDWLELNRHNISMGTRGLLTNTKLGGLRQDLSLAFEMDGEAEANEAEKFNTQDGVFVGGSDRLVSQQASRDQPVAGRYLHRNMNGSSGLFSSDIPVLNINKGPTWWALRDYSNLYKRITGTVGDYTLATRLPLPNKKTGVTELTTFDGNPILDVELIGARNSADRYVYRHSQPAYSPALIGMGALLSIGSEDSNLALYVDPYFIVWNPYNHRMTCPRYGIATKNTYPVKLNLIAGNFNPNWAIAGYLSNNGGGPTNPRNATRFSYSVDNLILEPGEVAFLTRDPEEDPSDTTVTDFNGRLKKGFHVDTGTGHSITKFSTSGGTIPTNTITSVTCKLSVTENTIMNMRTFYDDDITKDPKDYRNEGQQGATMQGKLIKIITQDSAETFNVTEEVTFSSGDLGSRTYFGCFSLLTKPANFSGENPTNIQSFAQFNPIAFTSTSEAGHPCALNQELEIHIDKYEGIGDLLEACGIEQPESDLSSFWGPSFASVGGSNLGGTTSVPMLEIPTTPLHSLVSFTHANLGIRTNEPINAIGNSLASPLLAPTSPYGTNPNGFEGSVSTAYDTSWLSNEVLFDNYYLSGFAPEFSISESGYSKQGELKDTIEKFFEISGISHLEAEANPVLIPYIPDGMTAEEIVDQLNPESNSDSYKKLGSYCMIKGAFNINSTSIKAWESMLRGNRGLEVTYAGGGTDNGAANTTPYPSGVAPSEGGLAEEHWAGVRRLTDTQITSLATEIVEQVKLRGPFMSLSDFVNHRVGGSSVTELHYKGAIQAAIDDSDINANIVTDADGTTVDYSSSALTENFPNPIPGDQPTTTNIPGDITQAKVLLPLAPRMTARSDTFKIRAIGESWSKDGTKLLARASCEAVVQRFPEYVNSGNNDSWDDAGNVSLLVDASATPTSPLDEENEKFGRRFKVINFRWLAQSEI